jgi:O-antigen/teichoic acid export membrane protein
VRVRRSLLNFATTALLMGVNMAVAILATPLLLDWLGESAYGGYRVVNDAYGYLTLLELGLGGAIAPLLARAIGRGDERALRETVAAGSRAYFWVLLATLAVGLVLTPVVPRFAKDLDPGQVVDLKRGWLLGLAAFMTLVLLPLRSVVEARQLGYVVNLLLTVQSLVITGTSLVLAHAGWGITGQALAQVAGVWCFSLALAAGVFRGHPGLLRAVLTMPTARETRRALRNLSAPMLVINVCGRVSVMSDNLIIGGILGAQRVAVLVNTQKLVNMGHSILLSVGNASWAALAELHAQGQRETFNRRLIEITRVVAVLAVVGLVPVVAYNRAFFRLWLPGKTYGGDLVIVLAAVNAALVAEQALWGWCFAVTGKARALVPQVITAAALNLSASVVLTSRLGLAGPLIGTTVACVGVGLWAMPWLLHRSFGTPVGPLLRAVGVPFAVGAAAAGALRGLTGVHEPSGWVALAAEMSLAALAMFALSVAVLLTPEDRALWRLRLRGLRPRRPVETAP